MSELFAYALVIVIVLAYCCSERKQDQELQKTIREKQGAKEA